MAAYSWKRHSVWWFVQTVFISFVDPHCWFHVTLLVHPALPPSCRVEISCVDAGLILQSANLYLAWQILLLCVRSLYVSSE